MKFTSSKWLHLAVALSLASGLTGCSDEDLAAGLGAVAIGAGAVAIGEASEHAGCEPGSREVCHEYRDYAGAWHRECVSEYEACFSRRWVSHSLLSGGAMGAKLLSKEPEVSESGWATAFNIGFAGSRKLIDALERAKDRDLSAVLALGLSRDDVKQMASRQLPSERGLEALAKNLDQDASTTRAMIQRILELSGSSRPGTADQRR